MRDVYELHRTDGDPGRIVTVLPGAGDDTMAPLLHYPRAALHALGWTVRVVRWRTRPEPDQVRDAAAELLAGAGAPRPDTTHLVVGRSVGSLALPVAAREGLAGVWLTPLLARDDAGDVRRAVAGLEGDHLLIGGTADPSWDHGLASGLRADVVEVHGGDHHLEVADDWRRNLETVEEVTAEIEHFAASFDVG